MKLSDYAKKVGVSYGTAWRWFKSGKLKGYQIDTGTIIVTEAQNHHIPQKVVVYTRVSSHEMKDNLNRQAERLVSYCNAKGWKVHQVVKEIGSGVNDNRKELVKILNDPSITIIVVEHKASSLAIVTTQSKLMQSAINVIGASRIICIRPVNLLSTNL